MKGFVTTAMIVFPLFMFAQTLQIKQGWQQYGAAQTIENVRVFDKDCIDTVLLYDKYNQTWDTHYTRVENANRTTVQIKEGEAFWVHATSDCTIDLSKKDTIWMKQTNGEKMNDNLKNSVREFYDLYWKGN